MEVTFLLDETTGQLTVEGWDADQASLLSDLVGDVVEVNCAKPVEGRVQLIRTPGAALRVHAIYHGSVVDGPGRRSVLQVQGCPIRCAGCFVPQTHDADGGTEMCYSDVLDLLLADQTRDGVTVLGGEPMAQAEALLPTVRTLRGLGIDLTLYTGFTVESLLRLGGARRELLLLADRVIDGPYVRALARGGLAYRGSSNQRLLGAAVIRAMAEEIQSRRAA